MSHRISVRAVVVAVAALLTLAGCSSSGPATIERGPDTSNSSASDRVGGEGLDALRTKVRLLSQDDCLTGDPASGQARCSRFAVEIRNVIAQTRRDAPNAAREADAAQGALDRYSASGCEAPPGTIGTGDPKVCGPVYAQVQQTVQALATAVGVPR